MRFQTGEGAEREESKEMRNRSGEEREGSLIRWNKEVRNRVLEKEPARMGSWDLETHISSPFYPSPPPCVSARVGTSSKGVLSSQKLSLPRIQCIVNRCIRCRAVHRELDAAKVVKLHRKMARNCILPWVGSQAFVLTWPCQSTIIT